MSYSYWKVEHTPFNNGYASSATTAFTAFQRPILETALGDTKDSFSLTVKNFNQDYNTQFNAQDKITIYRATNTDTVTTDDILMVGVIRDVSYNKSSKRNELKIDGFNFSESVLNSIVFVNLENIDVAAGIQLAIENAKNVNPNFGVTWDTNNPTLKRDGVTAFPDVNERYYYKPVLKIVEDLSKNSRTDDGTYYWYVSNDNKFVWRPDTSFGTGTFDDSTDSYLSLKTGKDNKDVRNYLIMKGGTDPAGNQIQIYKVDYASVVKNGHKYLIHTDQNANAQELIKLDLGQDNLTDRFPPLLSSSFTTKWVSNIPEAKVLDHGTTMTPGSAVTFSIATTGSASNSKKDYVQAIREEIKARLDKSGQDILDLTSNGKLKVDITFRAGTKSWGLGDQIKANISQFGENETILRVMEIQYSSTTDTYSLEEDIGSV